MATALEHTPCPVSACKIPNKKLECPGQPRCRPFLHSVYVGRQQKEHSSTEPYNFRAFSPDGKLGPRDTEQAVQCHNDSSSPPLPLQGFPATLSMMWRPHRIWSLSISQVSPSLIAPHPTPFPEPSTIPDMSKAVAPRPLSPSPAFSPPSCLVGSDKSWL